MVPATVINGTKLLLLIKVFRLKLSKKADVVNLTSLKKTEKKKKIIPKTREKRNSHIRK